MKRFRIPELFLGCFLTLAVFATGMIFQKQKQPTPAQLINNQAVSAENDKAQSRDGLIASSWLTKDAAGFFTFGLVIVGIGQVWLFFFQLRYMRRGMDDTKRAAEAAKESADAGKRQAEVAKSTLETMQDTAERQLRAYVGVSKCGISNIETGAPEAIVHIKNFGQTPAYDMQTWIHIWITAHPLRVILPTAPESLQKATAVLYPGSEAIHFMPKEPPVSAEHRHLIGTPHGTIYVYGAITYRDAFNKRRNTNFRLIYGGNEGVRPGLMKPDYEGNDSD